MKKISLLFSILTILFASISNAQSQKVEIVLSQNISLVLLPIGGLACAGGDNQWYREYILDEEGITGPVVLKSVEFGVQAIDATTELQVFAYDYEDFPDGFDINNPPTPLASGTVTVGPSDVGNFVRGSFDIPAVVTENTTVVVSVVQPVNGVNFFLGVTESETKPSFKSSVQCGPSTPISMVDLGFPDSRHLINLVVDNELSVTDQTAENFTVYPNPVKNTLNFSLASLTFDVIALFDIMGKKLNCKISDSSIDVSGLSAGTYFLKFNTTNSVITRKFVKR
ncbi:MAG TPA: T9SS type A sorting domain-containing protein [Aequorivita sp.]|nr:T9SS type A sorting domain-containing protein [Aequorivita sp.]